MGESDGHEWQGQDVINGLDSPFTEVALRGKRSNLPEKLPSPTPEAKLKELNLERPHDVLVEGFSPMVKDFWHMTIIVLGLTRL